LKIDILAIADALSDRDLIARLDVMAGNERVSTVELVAHLAALDSRPALYAGEGYGSLFSYCTQALRLSEDAACNRIAAARACRRFPVILDLLASGEVSLTSVRLLSPHLTAENHQAVLARAKRRSRPQIDALVAELAPRPDVPSSVCKLPSVTATPAAPMDSMTTARAEPLPATPAPSVSIPRPIVQPTAPERYRVQFTIGQETHEKLRRVQALLCREIPDGDPGAIFDRALTLLLEKVEKAKLGAATRPRFGRFIRSGTDKPSRNTPSAVRRAVWRRDGGQCAFVSSSGHRCTERKYLEFHHVLSYARGGQATIDNISLRCRRHNQYEAELIFGRYGVSVVREGVGRWPEVERRRLTAGAGGP
jgi:5-methylcytosine-specific restriction endonuclease McrA